MKSILKKIYHLFPFKKELFSLLKIIWLPSQKLYRHLHFKGKFKVKIDKGHSFHIYHHGFEVENEIFWAGLRGSLEKKSISLWIELCKKSLVIFDIGANTGVYSLIAKSMNPIAKIYAFEPVKRVYEKLLLNNQLNKYDIICIDKAISNFEGEATIYDIPTEHIYSVTVNQNLNSPDVTVIPTQISTICLSTVIEKNNLASLDLLKIDVETHEAEVLEGLGLYLEKFKPTTLIEILTEEVGKKVENLVKDKGYLFFYIDENKGPSQVPHIIPENSYNYLLSKPETAQNLGLIK